MKIIVIGAGIMGALIGYRLAEAGAAVTILDASQPASAASGASFGWINASFYADTDHFRLRVAGIEAHRRLAADLNSKATMGCGALCWEAQGAAFDAQYNALKELDYAVQEVNAQDFTALQPHITAPDRALYFPDEAAVDLVALTCEALRAGAARGVRLIAGVPATAIVTKGGAVCGVKTDSGRLRADQVIVAAGVGSQQLLRGVDVSLPLLDRPGLILRSEALPPLLHHVLAAPGQELRQTPTGHLLAPTAAHHQSDSAERITHAPDILADRAMARVQALIDRPVRWEQVTQAYRPVPQDGLPVIGACGPSGLYVTVMHSGATLAPVVAECASREIMGAGLSPAQTAMLAPYRLGRFRT